MIDETRSGCHQYTQVTTTLWRCTTMRTYRKVRYVSSATVSFTTVSDALVRTGREPMITSVPPYLGMANVRSHFSLAWNTAEPTNPPSP
jgi:hypothetical protein